jgi:protein-export membrane protein SecD
LEERTVGPGLGADSVAAGRIALIVGFIAVIGFMIVSYSLFGLFANVALIANLVLIMAVLSGLQATLTLPGIAGIVLTVGMAVDANVLIFERIREELASGKNPIIAIDMGYSRALGTILDANITTLLAAIILFQLGSGPIRGFAITLAIGIVTSVFTAFVLTRLFVALWLRRKGKPEALPI